MATTPNRCKDQLPKETGLYFVSNDAGESACAAFDADTRQWFCSLIDPKSITNWGSSEITEQPKWKQLAIDRIREAKNGKQNG